MLVCVDSELFAYELIIFVLSLSLFNSRQSSNSRIIIYWIQKQINSLTKFNFSNFLPSNYLYTIYTMCVQMNIMNSYDKILIKKCSSSVHSNWKGFSKFWKDNAWFSLLLFFFLFLFCMSYYMWAHLHFVFCLYCQKRRINKFQL